jgi:predicted enzyme related to lactoylglutathione lyase
MPDSNASFVWYELMTTDTDAAESFYRHVIGWRAQDSGLTDRRYTILSAGETAIGGMMALSQGMRDAGGRPGWMGYIGVANVDTHVGRVQKAGGTLHRAPEDIPGVGRFAIVADPQGAIFVLFQGLAGMQPPTKQKPGTPGLAGWHELHAANWEDAFAFYSGLFGWRKGQAMDMGPMGTYQLFVAGNPPDGEPIGAMMTKTPDIPHPFWLFYWNVEEIDAAAKRVTDKAGKVLHGPQEVPGGRWIVQCSDPQDAMFALLGPRNPR